MENKLYQNIINEIEQKIEDGILKVGDKLPSERELAINYQVSRNVVREAIKVLQEKELVAVKLGKGAYVTNPSNDILTNNLQSILRRYNTTLNDILEVREELETLIIRRVIKQATPQNIDMLKQICNEMEESKNSINKFVELDFNFHMALAKATQNKIFHILAESFFEISEGLLIDITRFTNDIEEVQEQHMKLVNAIESRDEKRAVDLMKQHIAMTKSHHGQ